MSISKSKQKLSDRYSSGTTDSSGNKKTGITVGKSRFSKPVVITAVILVIIIAGTIAVTSLSDNGKDSNDTSAYNLVVTSDNTDEAENENASKAAPGTYDVCMNSTWEFKDAKSSSDNAYVENLVSNSNTVNFTLKRNDNGDIIYKSPYLPVGSHLSNIKLDDESLSEGTYPCTLTYYLVDDNYQELSTLNLSVSVVIKQN